jgi:arylsulfatase A-like enzyme
MMIKRQLGGSACITNPHVSSLIFGITWLVAFLTLIASPLHATDRPNIVLIVLDDAAYSDIGVYGGEVDTPNIDRLVKNGMQFTQFHVTPNCSSTRASLLTGMDHHRTGLGTHGVTADNQRGKPGYEGYLNRRVATLPKVLQSAGYHTMMAGKWHLGSRDPETWPAARGFDDSFALLNGGASHWEDNAPLFPSKPSQYVENAKPIKQLPKGFYSSDYYTDKMIHFINHREDTDQPFFAFVSYTAPHNPLHAPKESIEKYKDKYVDGWDALQRRRLKNLKSRGLIASSVKPQPRPEWIPSWDSLDESAKQTAARDMAIYAGMVDRLDQNVGRLIARLKAIGQYENSLILVMSDNGPSKTTIADYLELDGAGADFVKQFNNKLDNRGLPGSSVDLGPGWAYGLAAPFRLMKGYQSQGRVLSPLIVKLPAGWKKQGGFVTAPVHVMDIMPTLLDVATAEHPAAKPGGKLLSMQGMSLKSLIQDGDRAAFDQRGFGGELFGIRSYRCGKWKILKLPPPYGADKWQLYDLSLDPGETTDLAAEHPGRLKEFSVRWKNYATKNGVVEPDKPVAYAKPPTK